MTYYCSLADGRAQMNADSTIDDALLLTLIGAASARIDLLMGTPTPFFQPWLEAREFEVRLDNVDSGRGLFFLPGGEPLMSITSVVLGGATLSSVAGYPATRAPITAIRRTDGCSWYENGSSDPLTVVITGVWGYSRHPAQAWSAVDALAAAIVSTTANTFTVADVDGANVDGFTPRISAGNLLQVDSEWMEVISTAVVTNTVTVRRGVNGSTAATHLIGAAVSVWQTEVAVRQATARQAGMLYARRGAYEQETITDVGIVTYPTDLVAELRGVLQGYQYI